MTTTQFEAYLHEQIPVTQAMQMKVVAFGRDGVIVSAPLEPNINHAGGGFGGSIASLLLVAAYGRMQLVMQEIAPAAEVVVQKTQFEYLAPVSAEFEAHANAPSAEDLERFKKVFAKMGKGRLAVRAHVTCRETTCAHFHGEYVAVRDF